jgi:DNA-binding NtrC family response regulator
LGGRHRSKGLDNPRAVGLLFFLFFFRMALDEPTQRVSSSRFILVEDSFPVADGLKYLLQSVGCEVVGMAGNVRTGLELVAGASFDVALLDIDLRGEHVTPIADAVRERGKPVIFLSGYGDAEVLPPHLRGLPRLEKPVDPNELFAVIDRALTPAD